MLLSFIKYQGAGNDFVLIDDRALSFPLSDQILIHRLCHRSWGIGADGLILIQSALNADAKMRIFNSDGKEASMCGNGLRAAALYLNQRGIVIKERMHIESLYALHTCEIKKEGIATSMGVPKQLYSTPTRCVWDTGVPHAVIFTEDISSINVDVSGKKIRHDPHFTPHGVNVSFVQKTKSSLLIRTYERGVEKETLACGTGACAAAIEAHKTHNIPFPMQVIPPSKIPFTVDLIGEEIVLIEPVEEVFKGEIII